MLAGGRLTFEPGQSSKALPAVVISDALNEADETIIVTLSNPDNALLNSIPVHTYTIVDNDAAPSVAFSAASSERPEDIGPVAIGVSLSAVSGRTVPGVTTQNIVITIIDNPGCNLSKTIIIDLSLSPTNATIGMNVSHTFTINDNELCGPPDLPSAPSLREPAGPGANKKGNSPAKPKLPPR